MKKLLLALSLFSGLTATASAGEVLCEDAYVDTIAVEARRVDGASEIGRSLVVSFKTSAGNVHTCNGTIPRYVYLKADGNEAVFNAMTSIAFMARANNYRVNFMVNTGARIYSADELAYIQIVDNTAIEQLQ